MFAEKVFIFNRFLEFEIYFRCKQNKRPTNFFKIDEKALNSEYHTFNNNTDELYMVTYCDYRKY
jgi:hypothetical protein